MDASERIKAAVRASRPVITIRPPTIETSVPWGQRESTFRAWSLMVRPFGFLLAFSWRGGYPFAAMTIYTPWRNAEVFRVNRVPKETT